MRTLITIAITLLLGIGAAAAQDLGNKAPVKPVVTYPENVPNPELQGGDTTLNATNIPSLPFDDSGTTAGYNDDYAGTCLYDDGAPDVVYRLMVPAGVTGLDVSLCGSSYDTGLYVFNSSLTQIACNDDYCGLQSQLDNVPVTPGQTYYLIVDGYSSASGDYVFHAEAYEPCVLTCPSDGYPENEPPLVDNYIDNWNGGCNTPPDYPFQDISGGCHGKCEAIYTLCGVSGWYLSQGSNYRDTDWYILNTNWAGIIEITADAEYATYLFELGPQDCGSVAVLQQATAGPCSEGAMTIVAPDYTPVWFWVGPTVFADPDGGDNMYDYVVWFTYGYIQTEPTTWGTLKSLFH